MFDASLLIGPIALPIRYLSAFAAVALAAAVVWFLLRRRPAIRHSVMDLAASAGVAFLIAWKLSPILWNPLAIFRAPLTILYAPGGAWGGVVGGAVAVIVLVLAARRRGRNLAVVGVPVLLIAAVAFGLYGLTHAGFSIAGNVQGEAGSLGYAPEITDADVRVLEGGTTTLEDLHDRAGGGPVVLNFWATWCGPCRAENPVKRAAHDRWKNEAVIVGVNLTTTEGGVDVVRDYVEKERIPYTVVLDGNGTWQRAFGIRGTPTTIVLASTGEVVDRRYGPMTRSWINASVSRALDASVLRIMLPRVVIDE